MSQSCLLLASEHVRPRAAEWYCVRGAEMCSTCSGTTVTLSPIHCQTRGGDVRTAARIVGRTPDWLGTSQDQGIDSLDEPIMRVSSSETSPGGLFLTAVETECPLQVVGTINAYSALLAERAGFRSLYLSGAGVANASFGVPDIGITTLADVVEDARRITSATSLPLLVDVDTGFGDMAQTVREMIRVGVAAIHLEDQVDRKRCGHLPGKQLVSTAEMLGRIKAAVDARTDPGFVVMARTDAAAVEGLTAAIDRASEYIAAGADMIFAEALTTLDEYHQFTSAVSVPVLANLTEFGKTPLFTLDELRDAGVRLALYPLTAFRAMSAAAVKTYDTLRQCGTQRQLIPQLQSRAELYDVLKYRVE